ncbi:MULTISPECIES: hypothetical protein [Ornithinibacillus]|uniref:hypothetical protein n=1 Tax=Ornithinibacillus TaxID=484508 RepID=UPI00069CD71A|nr:hypothetical protein [Ornithinibacillus contaminans]
MSKYKRLLDQPNIPNEYLNRTTWPTVNENILLDNEKKEIFIKRKKAIDMYIDNEKTINEICKITNINQTDLYRLLKRCLEIDNTGQPFGYRALIPNFRVKRYTREENIDGFFNDEEKKLTGAFMKFLRKFPDIEDEINEMVFKKKKNNPTTNIPLGKDLHRKFVNICKMHPLIDFNKGDYPSNTEDFGKRSFYRYIRQLKINNPHKSINAYGKDSEVLLRTTGEGDKSNNIIRPFQRVEFDGHKIDTSIAIKYTSPEGDEITDVMERIWLLAIVDCGTSCILGATLVLNKEYSASDVLTCIKTSILPKSPIELMIPGLKYPEYGGFPSDIIPETQYAVWDEMLFDNAKANIAKIVKSKLKKIVGCQVNTGPVGTPTRRPLIEKFFHLLEINGFQKLTTTTGSNLKDSKRQNPEEKAVKYEVTSDEIEQLLEVLITERNGTPLQSLNGLTPLEAMQQRINRKMPYRKLDEEYRDGYEFHTIEIERVIRGSLKNGRRPHITYMGTKYRNEVLSGAFNLIGEKLTLVINIDDLRMIKAYLPNGAELGILKATGKWYIHKHSLKLRKTILKLVREGQLKISLEEDNPIEVYHLYLKEKAKNNKSVRNQLASFEKSLSQDKKNTDSLNSDSLDSTPNSNSTDTKISNFPSRQANGKQNSTNINKYKKRERFSFNS